MGWVVVLIVCGLIVAVSISYQQRQSHEKFAEYAVICKDALKHQEAYCEKVGPKLCKDSYWEKRADAYCD